MKKIPWLLLAPVLLGLAGCFLPDSMYFIRGERYVTQLIDNYSGWGTPLFLLMYGAYCLVRHAKQKMIPGLADGLAGIYMTGLALFRAWHTFNLFTTTDSGSLAITSGAGAFPREGLLLLFLSGCWFIFRSLRKT